MEELDSLAKAVDERRLYTERYHAAIERGRHPRSFRRENDLWKHISRADERRISVQRGQRLRRVSSVPTGMVAPPSRGDDFSVDEGWGEDDGGSTQSAGNQFGRPRSDSQGSRRSSNASAGRQHGTTPGLSMVHGNGEVSKVESAIRPLTRGEIEIMAQLEKHKKKENKHGSVERRNHKLSRRMSMHRVSDAQMKGLAEMAGRREIDAEHGSRRKMKKRYTQRLVGVETGGEKEYEPMSDAQYRAMKKPSGRRRSYFGAVKHGVDGSNRQRQAMSPNTAVREVRKFQAREGLVKTKQKEMEQQQGARGTPAAKKRAKTSLPEFTSIENATIFYGSVVAFQMSDGKFLTVEEDTGKMIAHHWPGVEKYGIRQLATHPGPDAQNGRMLFMLYDMRNPGNQEPIRYGDPVWLSVCTGNGIPNWRKGSCVAARIMQAPQLCTIGLDSKSVIRNPATETVEVGVPVPLPCVMKEVAKKDSEIWIPGPISKENPSGWYSNKDLLYEKLYKERNAAAMTLGRWVMLPMRVAAQESIRRDKASFAARAVIEGLLDMHKKGHDGDEEGYENKELVTGTEIYLEQDWFYIAGNPSKKNREKIILRQLPGTNEDSALSPPKSHKLRGGMHKTKNEDDKEREVDRRGVFKIRLISGGQKTKGVNKEQLKVEATFHHARQQLKKSRQFRNGETREYENGEVKGGEGFCTQVRLIQQDIDVKNDNAFLGYEDDKLTRLESYFEDLYQSSPVKISDNLPHPRAYLRRMRSPSRASVLSSTAGKAISRGSRSSLFTAKTSNTENLAERKKLLLKLLHESVSGPHVNLWDPDRTVSARLREEEQKARKNAMEAAEQENRLSRLLQFSEFPEDELPSRSVSRANSRPSSKASSRPRSRGSMTLAQRMAAEQEARRANIVSDDAVARLLGLDKHSRPMPEVLGEEDGSMKVTIRASSQVEFRKNTIQRRKKEAERREKNEAERKARMFQAEIEKAEVEAKLHEIGQRRAAEQAAAREKAEHERLYG
jgi:hypothetical protein